MEQNHINSPEAATDEPASPFNPQAAAGPDLGEAEPDDASSTHRHDGFTPKRRRKFLKALRRTGCVRDACRKAKISDTAAYKLRRRDPDFAALWATALDKAGSDIELLAWQRGVDGIEEEVIAYGKVVGTRRKRDANLFRMLLQASNPAKYGGQGFGSRKELEKKIRKEIEAEQQAQDQAPDIGEVRERIFQRIQRLQERQIRDGEVYVDEQGRTVPAGYRLVPIDEPDGPGGAAPECPPEGDRTDRDASAPCGYPDRREPEPFGRPGGDAAAARPAPPFERKARIEPRIRSFGRLYDS
jgi:hypothetical protein